MREVRNAYKILFGKPEGKRPLRRWENNIRMDLREMNWEGGVDWMHLDQDRFQWRVLVNTVFGLHKRRGIS
jgi:hypothetical protein